jgi:putative iron-regulated protein
MKIGRSRWPSVLLALLLLACARAAERPEPAPLLLDPKLGGAALATYLQIAHATYQDSLLGVEQLGREVERLLEAPSPERLVAAQAAWLAARRAYAQSEVFRFYDGPIDRVELLVNTWPIDEAFVESGAQAGALGIIEDVGRYPQLSRELLTELNARDGETAISTGFHVIEFLLWGVDDNPDGPGRRSDRAFVVPARMAKATSETTSLPARRGQYLRLSTALLRDHLQEVRDAFAPERGGYRASFVRAPLHDGLYRALRGMAQLSGPELSGERMTVPYETKNQENEHSCFSDSTQLDLLGNAQGIENVCLGRYRRADGSTLKGVGICALLGAQQRALGAALGEQISESVRRVAAIPAPFDQAILGRDSAPGRVAIERAIGSLRKQAELLERTRATFGLSEPTALAVAQ